LKILNFEDTFWISVSLFGDFRYMLNSIPPQVEYFSLVLRTQKSFGIILILCSVLIICGWLILSCWFHYSLVVGFLYSDCKMFFIWSVECEKMGIRRVWKMWVEMSTSRWMWRLVVTNWCKHTPLLVGANRSKMA
jgi:hypothetical protein